FPELGEFVGHRVTKQRGTYDTSMTVFRVLRKSADLRRQGHCRTCQAMRGERCFGNCNDVHRARLETSGIAPASLTPMDGARRRPRVRS
ncbi:hypothetical protein, partial [Streptomyces sp. YIM 130001]|uniref:hypothetical protein n=1 Tax=Streptomyces sp. YIM 130001 TaxID=2259644 RepID=UPI001968EE3E